MIETARTMIGYLLVRGGVRQAALRAGSREADCVNMTKMLTMPNIDNEKFFAHASLAEQGRARPEDDPPVSGAGRPTSL
jgi:hypothetical protein